MTKAHDFRWQRRVAFAETDMAGILHFANYFRYMEEAEHAFFRSLGHTVHYEGEDGSRGFARGETSCRFERPLRYEDVVEIELIVRAIGTSTMRYEAVFRLDEAEVARGSVTAVHVGRDPDGRMRAFPLPAWIADRIEIAPD